MLRRMIVSITLVTALCAALLGHAVQTYGPPYATGPAGGDQFNRSFVDPARGSIAIVRAYPVPGAFSCGGSGGFATFQVMHPVAAPVSEVRVAFEDAVIDPYTWITVEVRNDGAWLGYEALRGPQVGAGSLTVSLGGAAVTSGTLTVLFGLQVASACLPAQSVDGGAATFPSVGVS